MRKWCSDGKPVRSHWPTILNLLGAMLGGRWKAKAPPVAESERAAISETMCVILRRFDTPRKLYSVAWSWRLVATMDDLSYPSGDENGGGAFGGVENAAVREFADRFLADDASPLALLVGIAERTTDKEARAAARDARAAGPRANELDGLVAQDNTVHQLVALMVRQLCMHPDTRWAMKQMAASQTCLRAIALQFRPGVYLRFEDPTNYLMGLVHVLLDSSRFKATCEAVRVPIEALGRRTLGDVLREAHDEVVLQSSRAAGGTVDGAALVATLWRLVGEYDLDDERNHVKGMRATCWCVRQTPSIVSGRGARARRPRARLTSID